MTARTDRWQERIQEIKRDLKTLGDMRPGALTKQYNVCGKPNCRCKDPKHPKKHGPYYQLSYTHAGKSTTEFVKKEMLAELREQLKTYARFRKLTEEWVRLSLRIAKSRKKQTEK